MFCILLQDDIKLLVTSIAVNSPSLIKWDIRGKANFYSIYAGGAVKNKCWLYFNLSHCRYLSTDYPENQQKGSS